MPGSQTDERRPSPTRAENKVTRREILAELKLDGCQYCGDTEDLQFHHIDKRSFNLAKARSVPWDRWIKEVAKCTPLCDVCHKALHAGDVELVNPRRYTIEELQRRFGAA